MWSGTPEQPSGLSVRKEYHAEALGRCHLLGGHLLPLLALVLAHR